MPALPPVPKTIRVRWLGTDVSDTSLGSSLYWEYTGTAPTQAQLDTFCTAVATGWNTNMAPVVDTGFTLTEVTAVDLTSALSATGVANVSHAGTRAGTALPLNVCFTLQLPTNLRRRGGRWHCQVRMGVVSDLLNPQQWTTTFVTAGLVALEDYGGAIGAAVWSGGGTLTNVGVQYYGPPNRTVTSSTGRVRTVSTLLPTPVIYPILSYNATQRLGSQRRRLTSG